MEAATCGQVLGGPVGALDGADEPDHDPPMTTLDAPSAATGPPPFLLQLLDWYVGAAAVSLIDVGHRTGLLVALAERPATSEELADRTGLSERHIREWLAGTATNGITDYDAESRRFTLPPERAAMLAGDSHMNLAPLGQALMFISSFAPSVATTFTTGGGIPYREYQPEFAALQDGVNRALFDVALVDGYVPAVPGLADRLSAGASVLDVGCGTGHVVNLLARAFPRSTFTGYDLSVDAITAARTEAASFGLTNATFEVRDVTTMPAADRFDVVTAFDAIHDQAQPRRVLAEIRRVLADDGMFVMVDINASSDLADNIGGHPLAPYFYWISLFHCMQVSLAEGGEGLGTAWGVQQATELLAEAGFGSISQVEPPAEDPINVIFVSRP